MKKKLLFITLSLFFSNVIITQSNNSSNNLNYSNKPKINIPLPDSAYEHIYELLKNDFSTADTEFIMFLQNRYKKNKDVKNLEEEDRLLKSFSRNFTDNKNLPVQQTPNCAFAAAVQYLYFHQLIAYTRSYPQNYMLTPFEQEYNFKLYPTSFENFIRLKNSLPAAQIALYQQAAIRDFAKFLLIRLVR